MLTKVAVPRVGFTGELVSLAKAKSAALIARPAGGTNVNTTLSFIVPAGFGKTIASPNVQLALFVFLARFTVISPPFTASLSVAAPDAAPIP